MIDILSTINQNYDSFSKSQRAIADYILAYYDKAAFMTAAKLAKIINVSESTVVRFAAVLGFSGYPEMHKALQEMLRSRLTSVQRIEASKEIFEKNDVSSAVLNLDIEQIRMTMENLNGEDFKNAVSKIVNAKHIYIFGLRSSACLASYMGFYFNLLFENVKVINENAVSEIFEQILRIGKNDVFICFSFPRYSSMTVKAAKFAHSQGATVIGITDNPQSPIAQIDDISLCAKSDMVSFIDSLVAPMSLVNALVVAVSAMTEDTDLEKTFEHLEAVWSEFDIYEKNEL